MTYDREALIITPDNTDFAAYMQETEPSVKVLPASAWKDALAESIANPERLTGARLPWSKTHDKIRFRPGEVTAWVGINGHGKSQMVGQAVLGFVAQEHRSCIASFEMPPVKTLGRMLRQVAMNDTPTQQVANQMVGWLEGRMWIYDQLGRASPEMLAAVIRYCADRLQIDHFVIDSLMRCVAGEDDYNGQKDFVEMLCRLAQDNNIHIHLVHHARKGESESRRPGKFDAKGSGAIVDQVDQLLTVWRNKKKENDIQRAIREGNDIPEALKDSPDALLACDKNRHGEWEGVIALWYHAQSLQYTPDSRCMPLDFLHPLWKEAA